MTFSQLMFSWEPVQRDLYVIAEQPAPAPHLAHPEGCVGLRIVLVTVPRVSRACEHFPDAFGIHLLPATRWSATLSSKVNLPYVIDYRASCGANLVTEHPKLWGQRNSRGPPCGKGLWVWVQGLISRV